MVVSGLLLLMVGSPDAALSAAERVAPARLVSWVQRLQSRGSRFAGTPGAFAAGDMVTAELVRLGLEVRRRPFAVANAYDGGRVLMTENIVASLGPRDGPRVVIIAHLDSRGAADPDDARTQGWRWDGSPAPGADDDASGCAALLELARVLRGVPLGGPVDLVFTGAEELARVGEDGFMTNLGAERLADDYAAEGAPLAGVIAVDMLLRPRPFGPALRVYSDGRLASQHLATALQLASWAVSPAVTLDLRVAPSFTFSDHGSFWAYGTGAVLLIEDDFHHPRYHTTEDYFSPRDRFYDVGQLAAATRILVVAVAIVSPS